MSRVSHEVKTWADLKEFYNSRPGVILEYVETLESYFIYAITQHFSVSYTLFKTSADSTEKNDFETNFKAVHTRPAGNSNFQFSDSSGNRRLLVDTQSAASAMKLMLYITSPNQPIATVNEVNPTVVKEVLNKTGEVSGFRIDFSKPDVKIDLKIDGNLYFSVSGSIFDSLKSTYLFDRSSLAWDKETNTFIFRPRTPVRFNTSFRIEAKSENQQSNVKLQNLFVEWMEV